MIRKKNSIEWLLRGVLTKIGDTFDRLTGRNYKPSSSLATTELIEKLRKLIDLEVKNGKFVPHNIQLKMQWDKFSTDSDDALKKLEDELKIAVIDHINDNRYHTYAPIRLQIKPDYFTEGVKLLVSFDKFAEEKNEIAINIPAPEVETGNSVQPPAETELPQDTETFLAHFTIHGKAKTVELSLEKNRRLSVGRGKENILCLEDQSVSKIHASLVMNSEKQLLVADTGSTNGTFINEKRIAYGRAFPIRIDTDRVKFGNVEVKFEHLRKPKEDSESFVNPPTSAVNIKTAETLSVKAEKETTAQTPQENFSVEQKLREQPTVSYPAQSANSEILRKTSISRQSGNSLTEKMAETTGTQERIVPDFSKEE
jgi:pSer/pThr/pTyr-binding forkhead associated (FHA) protein